jgi:hypothetical protein
MARVDVFRRLLFPLWRHFRRRVFARHTARAEAFALEILFREVRLHSVRLCRHGLSTSAAARMNNNSAGLALFLSSRFLGA